MKKCITIIATLFLSGVLFGQSDEILDKLYASEVALTSYTTLVVLQAAGHLTLDATVNDAKVYLETQEWGVTVLKDEEFMSKGGFSLLVMEAFDLPHGLIYNIFPSRRYALKEMVYRGYILGNPYPGDPISSFDVVYVLSSIPVDQDINKNYVDTESEEITSVVESVLDETVTEEITSVVDSVLEETITEEIEAVVAEDVEIVEDVVDTDPVFVEETPAETEVEATVSE